MLPRSTFQGGLHQVEINQLPTRQFIIPTASQSSASPEVPPHKRAKLNKRCQVCLNEYNNGDVLRVLPCLHEFHTPCIDTWLRPAILRFLVAFLRQVHPCLPVEANTCTVQSLCLNLQDSAIPWEIQERLCDILKEICVQAKNKELFLDVFGVLLSKLRLLIQSFEYRTKIIDKDPFVEILKPNSGTECKKRIHDFMLVTIDMASQMPHIDDEAPQGVNKKRKTIFFGKFLKHGMRAITVLNDQSEGIEERNPNSLLTSDACRCLKLLPRAFNKLSYEDFFEVVFTRIDGILTGLLLNKTYQLCLQALLMDRSTTKAVGYLLMHNYLEEIETKPHIQSVLTDVFWSVAKFPDQHKDMVIAYWAQLISRCVRQIAKEFFEDFQIISNALKSISVNSVYCGIFPDADAKVFLKTFLSWLKFPVFNDYKSVIMEVSNRIIQSLTPLQWASNMSLIASVLTQSLQSTSMHNVEMILKPNSGTECKKRIHEFVSHY